MSRLNDLLRELRTREPALARDLEREVAALAERRAFGLNFERHMPEAVELPGRKVRKGDKVRVLPDRGKVANKQDARLWRVVAVERGAGTATLEAHLGSGPVVADEERSIDQRGAPVAAWTSRTTRDGATSSRAADSEAPDWAPPVTTPRPVQPEREIRTTAIDDLVVVAEFRDAIYPGLVSTGKVERSGDKPFHTVINAENFHALETLLFAYRGKVDCIYVDPPYNTGAKDWKYNNDYVEGDDLYRHSKWLAFMERRLLLAKELLCQEDSVLIVTIDEKEYLRLGLLLEQTFPEATIQMVSIVINPSGTSREHLSRVDEYAFFCFLGAARPYDFSDDLLGVVDADGAKLGTAGVRWEWLLRGGQSWYRETRRNLCYPVLVNENRTRMIRAGSPLEGDERERPNEVDGHPVVWPVRSDGRLGIWRVEGPKLDELIKKGYAHISSKPNAAQPTLRYLLGGTVEQIDAGELKVVGKGERGEVQVDFPQAARKQRAKTVWNRGRHIAGGAGGAHLLSLMFGERGRFTYPKSLYALEDTLRIATGHKPQAIVLDFFAGSGTTAHAVMRLNKQDGGRRVSISVTNNEVSADEQKELRDRGCRPGDPEWEKWGICEYVTKPRIAAAITGKAPNGEEIKGKYAFGDEFPIADGFEENVECFTLTYEAPLRVASNREFAKIAPLLWMRAGARGRRIDGIRAGWDVADTYGVLVDLDQTRKFLRAVAARHGLAVVYIVTDEDRLFESVARALPEHVEPVRLYEAYLRNFEIESGRGVR